MVWNGHLNEAFQHLFYGICFIYKNMLGSFEEYGFLSLKGKPYEAVLPSKTRLVLGGKFWSSAQSPESWLNQGSNMANIIYFFLNAKQFLMCPRQHQCLSWGVKLTNIFSLCGKASCSSVSKEIFKVLLLMQFLFSYYYDVFFSK